MQHSEQKCTHFSSEWGIVDVGRVHCGICEMGPLAIIIFVKLHKAYFFCEVNTLYLSQWANRPCPLNTWRYDNVVITSKLRHFDVITSKWRRFGVITTSSLGNVSAGCGERNDPVWSFYIDLPGNVIVYMYVFVIFKHSVESTMAGHSICLK